MEGKVTTNEITVSIVLAYCVVAIVGSHAFEMTWKGSFWELSAPGFALVAVALIYRRLRPSESGLYQIPLFAGLWLVQAIAATQLSFIANAANMPLQTELFAEWDAALGFDWSRWALFVQLRPLFSKLLELAYMSHAVQPFTAVVLVAICGPKDRNANLLLAIMISLTITIAVSALIPAIEPGYFAGYNTPAAQALIELREGQRVGLEYIGIICFPSFHTVMAIQFALVYRGMHRGFLAAAITLNALMLLSVPVPGDHYLVDVLAGIVVALIGQFAANAISRRFGHPAG